MKEVEAFVITARLDLLIRLVDTTTGAEVKESNVHFMRNGKAVRPENRGNGNWIFINTGREDFLMQIKVKGYEEYEMPVRYEALDQRLPTLHVFLLPTENTFDGERILSFSGTLPFLEKIEAVNLTRPVCTMREFNPKKCEMSVFAAAGGRVQMDDIYYGILNPDKQSYEKIEITGNPGPTTVKIAAVPETEISANMPIMRIVFGQTQKDGSFLLRVRDDAEELKYLIRFGYSDKTEFKTVDLRAESERGLT